MPKADQQTGDLARLYPTCHSTTAETDSSAPTKSTEKWMDRHNLPQFSG